MKLILTISLLCLTFLGFSQEEKIYKSLEEAIKSLESVIHLDLSGQGLVELPKDFKKMVNLKTLDLSNNKLTDLGKFADFRKLEALNLSGNPLTRMPYFININLNQGNVIAENCDISKIEVSLQKDQKILDKDFEGTIRISPEIKITTVKIGNEKPFIRIKALGEDSKYWIEIHKKEELTNENILDNIVVDQYITFNYFLNKQITFDSPKDTLPLFVMYQYTDNNKKVGIVSNKAIVFYEKYYIIINSTERSIMSSDVKKLLKSALTYRPKDNGFGVKLDINKMNIVDVAEFANKSVLPNGIPCLKTAPAIKPQSEIIHSLVAGETVAFTDEYQLGMEMKESGHYIYIKKGGKYYLKTKNDTFGPFDELTSADPNYSTNYDITQKFHSIKDKQNYYICAGKQFGPYPNKGEVEAFVDSKGEVTIIYTYQEAAVGYFAEVNGKKTGPFVRWPYYYFVNDRLIISEETTDGAKNFYINGELKLSNVKMQGYTIEPNNSFFLHYIKDGKSYLQNEDESFGPYDNIEAHQLIDKKPYFSYVKDGKSYVYYDGNTIGPFDKHIQSYFYWGAKFFICMNGTEYFAKFLDGKTEGPFSTKPEIKCNLESGAYYFIFGKDGEKYVMHNSKKYGPFKKVFPANDFAEKQMEANDKLPILTVENSDGTFSVYLKNKIYGPFSTNPGCYFSGEKVAFSYTEKNSSGVLDHYLIIEDKKIGPFSSIISDCASYSAGFFCGYNIYLTTKENKYYWLSTDQLYGPFDYLKREYRNGGESKFQYVKDDKLFLFSENKVYGPYTIPQGTDEKRKYNFSANMSGSHCLLRNDVTTDFETSINELKLKDGYYVGIFDDNDYVLVDDYSTTNRSFVINGVEYKKNILNTSWDDESQSFYWISLEGKNIVKSWIKL